MRERNLPAVRRKAHGTADHAGGLVGEQLSNGVEMCPLRTDFSRDASLPIAWMGKKSSISLRSSFIPHPQ